MNMLSIGMSEVVLPAPVYAVTPVCRQLLQMVISTKMEVITVLRQTESESDA